MTKASSGPRVSLLGLRSQLFPGIGVMAMACSPGRATDVDGGHGVGQSAIWVLKNLGRPLALTSTWLQYGPLELGGETVPAPNP